MLQDNGSSDSTHFNGFKMKYKPSKINEKFNWKKEKRKLKNSDFNWIYSKTERDWEEKQYLLTQVYRKLMNIIKKYNPRSTDYMKTQFLKYNFLNLLIGF